MRFINNRNADNEAILPFAESPWATMTTALRMLEPTSGIAVIRRITPVMQNT